MKLSALPVRAVKLEAHEFSVPQPKRVLEARGVGFIGAIRDQQLAWIGAFRRLLDGLEEPLQVVMRFDPGGDRQVKVVSEQDLTQQLIDIGLQTSEVTAHETDFGDEYLTFCRDLGGWHASWYLDGFPGEELEPGWLLRLVPSETALTIAWHAEPMPTAWVIEYLRRQIAHMRASNLAARSRGMPDLETSRAMPAAEDLQRRLLASEERAFRVGVYLTASGGTYDQLEGARSAVEAAARAGLVTLRRATFRQRAARVATMPTGQDPLARRKILDTSSLATLFPWLDADVRDPAGMPVGSSAATGIEVDIDPFDQRRYENANIGVFGHSGAGKTYLLSTLAMGQLERGSQVFIIDPEHEYGRLAAELGGSDIQLSLGSGHSLNVMDMRPGDAAIADSVELLEVICGGIDVAEKTSVEEAIRRAYEQVERPVLGDVAARLPPGRTAKVLKRWVAGALGQMFSAPTNVDLDAAIVAFGMRELREEMVAPVHFLLAEALWRRIRERTKRTLLVVDELGILFEDATIRRFVVRLARRIRKYNGGLLFATQNPGDLLSSEAGTVVATNPAIRFFGAQRPSEALKLQRAYQLSDVQRQYVEAARRGEFLLCAGHDRLPLRAKAPPWQEQLIKKTRA